MLRGAAVLLPTTRALAQDGMAPEISADAARRDLALLRRALLALHPGLERYTTLQALDAEFAATDAAVAGGVNRGDMLLLASRLAAAVRCGHTWTNPINQRDDLVAALAARADKLPLRVRWIESRVLVTASADAAVAPGSELLAIDGRAVGDIAAALLPCLRADGSSDGKRWSQLDSGPNGGAVERLLPLRFPPRDGRFRLTLAGRTVDVAALDGPTLQQLLPPRQRDDWSLRIDGDTALLTLPTFAFWRSSFKPEAFLNDAFASLRGVRHLVIDQRDNEGGDDATGRLLLSWLLRRPLDLPNQRIESAYERVPYALARHLDTWDFGFFDRTGQVTKTAGRNWRLPDAPPRRIDPQPAPYAGRTIVLIGPQNSSAGFLFARDVQASGAATLVGQPTGGNLRGLNGGQLAWLTLPASGVAVDIPLIATFAPGDPPDAGVQPMFGSRRGSQMRRPGSTPRWRRRGR